MQYYLKHSRLFFCFICTFFTSLGLYAQPPTNVKDVLLAEIDNSHSRYDPSTSGFTSAFKMATSGFPATDIREERVENEPTPVACSIVIKSTVSGCYQNAGVSKATVSVEVAWATPPANDSIRVTLGTQTRYIRIGTFSVNYGYGTTGNQTIVSPQVVAFEVNANGASGTVSANFTTNAACTDTDAFTAPAACPPIVCTAGTDLGGIAFNDYDADGTQDTGETTGLTGVTVTAIACDGTTYTTTTDIFGKYKVSVPAAKYPVRVEFTTVPTLYGQGTLNGTSGKTTTQFVNAATCNVNLGVLDPVDYCQVNPKVMLPCYVYGDPQVGSVSGLKDALVSFDYSKSGYRDPTAITVIADAQMVGSLWGVAYNKFTNKLFASANIKRHSGLGPRGIGGIYVLNPTGGLAASWSVSTIGINVGAILPNTGRNLSTDPAQPSRDTAAWYAIGRRGIGDLELSEDGNTLWLINQFDKKLYS